MKYTRDDESIGLSDVEVRCIIERIYLFHLLLLNPVLIITLYIPCLNEVISETFHIKDDLHYNKLRINELDE